MQVNHTPSLAPVPTRFPWFFSLILAAFVALSTVGLWGYNWYLSTQIAQAHADISNLDTQIQTASQDRKIILTQILKNNTLRPSLDITGLMREFQKAAIAANVRLKGFNVKNDVISTTLIATKWDAQIHPDPASTVISMMRDYARGMKYFSLEPISTLAGTSKERTTSIQLKVVGK